MKKTKKVRCLIVDCAAGACWLQAYPSLAAAKKAAGDKAGESLFTLTLSDMTGTGLPGSNQFTVTGPDGQARHFASRLGAALRYAGADAILFEGKCETPSVLVIDGDGETMHELAVIPAAKLTADPAKLYEALCDRYLTDNTVISCPSLAEALADTGIAAVAVTGTGGFAVDDPAALIAECAEIARRMRKEAK